MQLQGRSHRLPTPSSSHPLPPPRPPLPLGLPCPAPPCPGGPPEEYKGDALALLLSRDGEFVRGIVTEELAKGLDAAWRVALDEAVATLRAQAAATARGEGACVHWPTGGVLEPGEGMCRGQLAPVGLRRRCG